ncbi:hypothetical protein TVAG_060440 [Trichomonas vaginalis G3]|uniref:Uncharacterized protein n=1 Tax=Trichomonas vaginalis (strain ATCC PRA-98 / G3) TaxID=412133 RepID=A2ECH3_TRIV3|nr:A-type inclusion protein-related family [Trichomonas vaginalis G3]EAY09668.1 hypothetical protein TVAG_060440 [Trichomonas vaginalis G3]KAI5528669.1 A-type inclusion protein-related family [Trichomonas vaginalis G3]|eukprot:XP_001321891.1 hypothetical protein [Trichomonas vaginalis G3]
MLDCTSESENASFNYLQPNESTGDSTLLAEARNSQLQEDNASLVKELNVLRAQFEQAVALSQKTVEIRKENDNLKNQILELNSQKEDALHRLEIAIRTKNEALQQLDEKTQKDSQQRQADVNAMQKEMAKTKKAFQNQLDKLYTENQKLQNRKEQDEILQKTLVGKIEKLVTNSARYFGRQISNIDDLTEIFEKEVFPSIQQNDQEQKTQKIKAPKTEQESPSKYKELHMKYKTARADIKAFNQRLQDLLNQLSKKDQEINAINRQNTQQINALKEKITLAAEEKQNLTSTYNRNLHKLETKVLQLKNDLQKANNEKQTPSQPQMAQQPVQQQPIIKYVQVPVQQPNTQPQNPTNNADTAVIEQMTIRIQDLQGKLDKSNKNCEDLQRKVDQMNKKNEDLIISHEGDKNNLKSLQIVHEQTVKELETVRTSLRTRDQVPKKCQKCKDYHRIENENNSLKAVVEKLEKSTFEAHLSNEKLKQELSDSQEKLKEQEKQILSLEEKNRDLQNDTKEMEAKISSFVEKKDEDFMPPSVWTNCNFDDTLNRQIQKIANNEQLSSQSKLQNIYKQIEKYIYRNTLEMKEQVNNSSLEMEKLFDLTKDFFVSLCISLYDEPISFDEFLTNNTTKTKVIETVRELRNKITELLRQNESVKSVFRTLCHFYKVDEEDFVESTKRIMAFHDDEVAAHNKIKEKLINIKKSSKEMIDQLKSDNQQLSLNFDHLKDDYEDLKTENNKLQDQNKQMKKEIEKMKETNQLLNDKVEDLEEINQEMKENNEKMINNEKQKLEEQYKEEIQENESQINDLTQTNEKLNNELQNMKKLHSVFVDSSKEKEEENEKKLKVLQKSIAEKEKRFEEEKNSIIKSYEQGNEELKKQCDEHREDVIRLSKEISCKEKMIREMKDKFIELQRNKKSLEHQIKTNEEEMERERKIKEAEISSIKSEFDSRISSEINKVKEDFMRDQRKMISYVVDRFRTNYNANTSIDERSLRMTVNKAANELEKFHQSDERIRRLIGARPSQSTEDAVAQAIIQTSFD